MYTYVIYNTQLNESKYEEYQIDRYSVIFDKLDIFYKNSKLMNEGYKGLSNNILFSSQERESINEMLSYLEYKLLENYLDEASFKNFLNWAKEKGLTAKNAVIDFGKKAYDKAKEFVIDLSKLPGKIKTACEFIEKLIKAGIQSAKDFVKYIAKLFATLGLTIKDAVLSFGIFGDSITNNYPKLPLKFAPLAEKDKKSDAIFNYVMQFVYAKCKSGQYKQIITEAEAGYKDSITSTLDRWALSHKDSWLEKSKNNTLFRLFLSGTNANGERLGFFKVLLISILGSFIVCTLVPLVAASTFGLAGTGLVILTISCKALWVLKNVSRIIINRTLTYKQSFKYDGLNLKHSRLFDNRTIISLCIAVITPTLFTIYHQEISDWLHSLFPHDTPDPTPLVEEHDPVVIEDALVMGTPVHVEHTPDPTPIIHDALNTDVEPVVAEVKDIPKLDISDVKGVSVTEPIVVKLPDQIEPLPVEIKQEAAAEAVQQMNVAAGNVIEGDLNLINMQDVNINVKEVTNVYNGASRVCGGVHPGIVVVHDIGHNDHMLRSAHDHFDHYHAEREVFRSGHWHAVDTRPAHTGGGGSNSAFGRPSHGGGYNHNLRNTHNRNPFSHQSHGSHSMNTGASRHSAGISVRQHSGSISHGSGRPSGGGHFGGRR